MSSSLPGVLKCLTRAAAFLFALSILSAPPASGQTFAPSEDVSGFPFSGPDVRAASISQSAGLSFDEDAAAEDDNPALERARLLLESVRAASYPELSKVDIRLRPFRDESDYFRTRLSVCRFLLGRKMRFIIEVNSRVFDLRAPEEGLRAILAHELAHVLYLSQRKRVRLFGLARLLSEKRTARFERWTDLQAIARGYGAGLVEYRRWLYRNIPPVSLKTKRRNYFSPEEIDAVLTVSRKRPEVFAYWLKHVPLNLDDILRAER